MRGAGGCLTAKKGARCGAILLRCGVVFVDLFHFLLLFVTFFTAHNFYKLLFTAEIGVKFVTFFNFLTTCNFHKLLLPGPGGPGFIFFSLWDMGERVHLDFFPSFF